jgi:ATP-dependent Clp protease protease subunit
MNPLVDSPFNAYDRIGVDLLNNHVHFLTSEIETNSITDAMRWLHYENTQEEKTLLTLYINSPGGCLADAFALIDMMRLSKHPIRTIGIGTICSAALLIFSSGTKGERLVSKNAELMMHQYSNEVSGKHHELKSHIMGGDLTNNRMIKLFQDTSNLDAKAIKSKLLSPTDAWLTADELLQYGIADKIF